MPIGAPYDEAVRKDATFTDDQGVVIHHYRWDAERPRAVVQLVHGLGEYATRYEQWGLIPSLVGAGYSVEAEDHRGHGATGLEQWKGDRAKLGRLGPGGWPAVLADVRRLSEIIRARDADLPLVLFGHSLGSIIAQQVIDADDGAGSLAYDAVVLSGTAYRTFGHMNSGDLNKRHSALGPTTAEWLSRDRAVVDAFVADPLTFEAKALSLFGVADSLRLMGRPGRLQRDLPLYIVIGDDDPLGGPRSVELLAQAYGERGGLSDVTVQIYPGARHEVFNETNRVEAVTDLLAWLGQRLPQTSR